MGKVQKATEIKDAKIRFVSLVDKAANLRQFLVTKGANGAAKFSTYGKILKVDAETHYITGIVYEPLVEDAHGDFMTEEEIKKAAYWYAENGDKVDIQHSFETAGGLSVVENYVAPSELTIGDTTVAKGSWVITVKCTDDDVWAAVQAGELTGFSMGGIGKYSEEDTDLDTLTKGGAAPPPADKTEKKGLLKTLGKLLGMDIVEKGEVLDRYNESARNSAFWNAVYALEDVLLYHYDYRDGRWMNVTDPETVREALEDFSKILTEVMTLDGDAIIKAITLPALKAGKKMSGSNKAKLDEICQALSDFKSSFDEDEEAEGTIEKKEEHKDMDQNEIVTLVNSTVTKALTDAGLIKGEGEAAPASAGEPVAAAPAPAVATSAPAPEGGQSPVEAPTEDAITKAVKKALVEAGLIDPEPAEPEPITKADVEEVVAKAVSAAVEPLLKARGLPQNLNGTAAVEKADECYLHGLL